MAQALVLDFNYANLLNTINIKDIGFTQIQRIYGFLSGFDDGKAHAKSTHCVIPKIYSPAI